jgi:two-component SAPR family response regulator
MRAVLIDDEKPALAQIEWLLERDGRLEVAAKFTSAREGINYLSENHADIVFLDIEMPGVNGLEAAEQLRQFRADIRIVYITAYSEYAIEAFDLHALDYLLKPVHPDRFKKTVTRILEDLERIRSAPEKTAPPPLVKTFTRLGIYDGGSGTSLRQFRVLRTLKAQELFAYFIHRKEQWISKDQLMEILWPGGIYEKGMVLLHTSVYQIRKLLREWDLKASVEFALDSYRLTGDGLAVDRELFERGAGQAKVQSDADRENALRVLDLYTGEYLGEHDYEWAVSRRDELRQKYMRLTHAVANFEAMSGRVAEGIERLVALHAHDPYSDEICFRILELFSQAGDDDGLLDYYDRYANLLRDELNASPEDRTVRYAERVRNGRKGG